MEIRNFVKVDEKIRKNSMTEFLGMIWKINFWNMKKIGKKTTIRVTTLDMISTFRACATSVHKLKLDETHHCFL
jgi:hypothetical protein